MPNPMIESTDVVVAQNFWLEVDGIGVTTLSGISGLDMEVDVVSIVQNTKKGQVLLKTLGSITKTPDITVTRLAPKDRDAIWNWFQMVRDKDSNSMRKNGSIVIYDQHFTEVGRYNFYNGWPSKISVDSLSTDSNEAVKETITIVSERIDRVK